MGANVRDVPRRMYPSVQMRIARYKKLGPENFRFQITSISSSMVQIISYTRSAGFNDRWSDGRWSQSEEGDAAPKTEIVV